MGTKIFKTNNGLGFGVKATKKEVSKSFLGYWHQVYNIWILRGDQKQRFTFHDSAHNYELGKGVTTEMLKNAVECIIADSYAAMNCPTYSEFADEFGYWEDNTSAGRRAFNGCHNNLRKMQELFSMEEIEDINQTLYSEAWDTKK